MWAGEGPTAPDSVDPVIGWRAWALAIDLEGTPALRPIVYAAERWPPMRAATASCPPHGGIPHRSPDPGCSCGLYAVGRADELSLVNGRDVTVIGSAAMWGRLIEHEDGLRAEFAYPQRLALVCGRCWETGSFQPHVATSAPTSRGTVLALCAEHGGRSSTEGPARELLDGLLTAYAVDPLPTANIGSIATGWGSTARRRRDRRGLLREALPALAFFALYLGIVVLALSLR